MKQIKIVGAKYYVDVENEVNDFLKGLNDTENVKLIPTESDGSYTVLIVYEV